MRRNQPKLLLPVTRNWPDRCDARSLANFGLPGTVSKWSNRYFSISSAICDSGNGCGNCARKALFVAAARIFWLRFAITEEEDPSFQSSLVADSAGDRRTTSESS